MIVEVFKGAEKYIFCLRGDKWGDTWGDTSGAKNTRLVYRCYIQNVD